MGYNSTNDVITIEDAKSKINSYDYNSHNIKQGKSQSGVTTNYSYNDFGNLTQMLIQDPASSKKIQTNTTYSENGAYINTVADPDNYITTYSYDTNKGLLDSVTDARNNMIQYNYNDKNDLLTSITGTVNKNPGDEKTVTNTYDYLNQTLSKITHNGFSYNFLYDAFNNVTNIKVGNTTLVSYYYKNNNGDLSEVAYGNDDTKKKYLCL